VVGIGKANPLPLVTSRYALPSNNGGLPRQLRLSEGSGKRASIDLMLRDPLESSSYMMVMAIYDCPQVNYTDVRIKRT